jgi:transcriptional regulator with XRE-family HTH domain
MDDAETDSPGVESEDVITYLRKLRLRHGNPSCRIIAQAVGISHTHANAILQNRIHRPSWEKIAKITGFLNGDVEHAKTLWDKQHWEENAPGVTPVFHTDGTRELLSTISDQLAQIIDLLRAQVSGTPQDHE